MEPITVITLVLRAIDRVNLNQVFDRDPYESRRTALPGARLVKALVVYHLFRSPHLRNLGKRYGVGWSSLWSPKHRSRCPRPCDSSAGVSRNANQC